MKALFLCSLLLAACSSESTPSGLAEPLRARYGLTQNAQFRPGSLPGSEPLTSEQTLSGVAPSAPTTDLSVGAAVVTEGATGFSASGVTSGEAVAVGIRLLDLGSGYWVLPVSGEDPTLPGSYTWGATLDFGANIPPGFHPLGVVALDASGHGGTQVSTKVCIESDIPDNLRACSPTSAPPSTVLSLAWDTPVDLDLRVVTPSGKIVDPKHPSTADAVNGKYDPTAPNTGVFDRDALLGCVNNGDRRENLVWQDAPVPGRYVVYASLYDACGQSAVHFTLSLNQSTPLADGGTPVLDQVYERSGELLATDADAGVSLGLFVTEFLVQ